MKILIIIDDSNYSNLNYLSFETSNPGVGGTLYQMICIHQLLNPIYEVTLYHNNSSNFKDLLKKSIYDISKEDFDTVDIMVFDKIIIQQRVFYSKINFLNLIKKDVYFRCGNYLNYNEYKLFKGNKNIKLVFLNKTQALQYYDTEIYNRIIILNNFINYSILRRYKTSNIDINNSKVIIVYIGSISPSKGLDKLIGAWPSIFRNNDNLELELWIIGSDKLYGEKIADENYQNKILNMIDGFKSKEKTSIRFFGNLGEEKYELIRQATIGIVNPIGNSEVFTNSAIDFILFNIPIVTIHKFGLKEIVDHKVTGFKYKNVRNLSKTITKVLSDYNLLYKIRNLDSVAYLKNKFDNNNFVKWTKLLESNFPSDIGYLHARTGNISIRPNALIFINKFLRTVTPLFPPIIYYSHLIRIVKARIKHLVHNS
jgi:glycosyltransferase involved in cell wall biosynthesis